LDQFDLQECPAYDTYKGPSAKGVCNSRDDSTCVSPGPDIAIGLIDITVLRLDIFQFSTPYHYTRQAIVRQPIKLTSVSDAFLNIFKCFSVSAWIVIAVEVLAATILLYLIEVTQQLLTAFAIIQPLFEFQKARHCLVLPQPALQVLSAW
jgi:hypothetical protein